MNIRIKKLVAIVLCSIPVFGWAQIFQKDPNVKSGFRINNEVQKVHELTDAGDISWGYFTGLSSEWTGIGSGGKASFGVAIFLPGDIFSGANLKAIKIPVLDPNMTEVSVWARESLEGSNVCSVNVSDGSFTAMEYTEVKLSSSYLIPSTGLYVGYSFTSSESYPVAVAGEEAPNALFLELNNGGFSDYYGNAFGVSPLQVVVNGLDLKDYNASFVELEPLTTLPNIPFKTTAVLSNTSNNPVNSIDYTIDVDGRKTSKHLTLSNPIPAGMGQRGVVEIEGTSAADVKAYTVRISIDKVNGMSNSQEGATSTTFLNVSKQVVRRTVVEEFTGTSCGWCPRGWVGMERMKKNYPDTFIGIALHKYSTSDPMYVANYYPIQSLGIYGAPGCNMDRRLPTDPYRGTGNGITNDFERFNAILPSVDVRAEAKWNDDSSAVDVTSFVEPLTSSVGFTVAYVLTADGLTGTSSAWKQLNFYASSDPSEEFASDPEMVAFCRGGEKGQSSVLLTFDDVMIGSSYSAAGKNLAVDIAGSDNAQMGTIYEGHYSVLMPTKATLIDAIKKDFVFANVLVIDNGTGEILNAARCPIGNIESDPLSFTISSNGGGSVSYMGVSLRNDTRSFTVNRGSSANIVFSPDNGYRIANVKVNNTDVTANVSNNQYTVSNISVNTTVAVTFEQIPATTYTLSIQSGSGGSVSYNGTTISNTTKSFSVESGSSATITITPNSGYRLGKLTENGTDRTSNVSNSQYTISNITANTTVSVTFEQIPATTYTLSIQSGSGGSVSYNGTTISNTTKSFSVTSGSSPTITITPNSGYRLSKLTVNGTDRTSQVSNNKYTISSISANTTVVVTFEQIPTSTYSLYITASGSGTVTYNGTNTVRNTSKTFTVNSGANATLSFSPDDGYRIASVKVNSTDVTSKVSNNQYTISSISANTTVAVTFEQIPTVTYTLTITATGNGSATYNGTNVVRNQSRTFTVNEGATANITFSPDDGYRIASVKLNNTDVTIRVTDNQFTINNIKTNRTLTVTFEKIPTYTLSIQASGNGSVTYNGTNTVRGGSKTFTVNEGGDALLSFVPDDGYKIASVKVNNTDVTSKVANNQYTISNITANTTVAVTFTQITYSLNVQASGSGTVTYSGTSVKNGTQTFTVNHGSSATLTLKPDSGCRLASLAVNGTDVTEKVSNSQYTISNITATTYVVATFEEIPITTYTLSIQSGSGGSVSYNGIAITNATKTYTVAEGASATITITPDSGYRLNKVTVNGTDVTSKVSNNQYTVGNITANTTVVVTFEQIPIPTYTLTVTASGNGNASFSGETIKGGSKSFTLNEGTNATITFTPDNGYRIASVKVNNADVTSLVKNNQYTVSSISANTTVAVTFDAIPPTTYQLTISASGNGSASYSGETIRGGSKTFTLNEGTNATITFTPDNGYRIAGVKVNNTDVASQVSNNQYTVGNITANTTVSVTFEQIPIPTYTLTVTASGNGSATYNGTTVRKGSQSFSLEEGSSATIAFTPDEWHQLGSVKVNNSDVTSSIANNQYTVSNIKSNTTVTVTFTEIEYSSLTNEGVNYRVVSNPNKTVSVASGSYGYWLMVPATFTANGFEWSVTGIDKDVISGNPQLAAIIWNPAVQFSASVNNPNFLLYVTSSQYAPSSIKNVVVGNTANSITLTDASSGNNFYCPREFTAKQISYSHSYGMTTGINEARGWESIALPFDVEAITHSSKGNLVPFSRWQEGSNDKPFWLCELGSSGFVATNSIKANTPYIISMPNNAEYKDEYRVAGTITFSSTDVKVKSSESLENGSYSDRTFVPNFINQDANSGFYVLNAVNNYSANSSGYAEGSRFVRNLRAIHPFEAYIASANNAKELFPIFEDTPTWIQLIKNSKLIMDRVYNLSGQQVKIEGDHNYGSLKKGVYIVNGKKVVIK